MYSRVYGPTGRARTISFELFLPLTGIRAAGSSVDGRVFGVIIIISTLMVAASGLAVVISWFRSAMIS